MADPDRPVPVDVRARLAAGMTDDDIRAELDLSFGELAALKKAVQEEDLVQVRHQSAEQVYVDARTRLLRIAGDLVDVSVEARAASQFTAAMGALKAEATVIDRTIRLGQDLGVLPRAARHNTHTVTGGLLVGAMTDGELTKQLRTDAEDRRRLQREYGEGSFGELPDREVYPDVVDAEPPKVPETATTAPTRRSVR